MMGSALYAACREVETPRTLKEIAETMNIKKGDLAASYRLLVKELDLKMPVSSYYQYFGFDSDYPKFLDV